MEKLFVLLKKKDSLESNMTLSFPKKSIGFCIEETKILINEIETVVFYDKPLIKFERILETYLSVAPFGIKSFLMSIPIWLREKLFLKNLIFFRIKKLRFFKKFIRIFFLVNIT